MIYPKFFAAIKRTRELEEARRNTMVKPTGNKGIRIKENLWFFKGKFLNRVSQKDGRNMFLIYNKFEKGKPCDFVFEAMNIKTVMQVLDLFNEELPHVIVPEVHPDYYTVAEQS